LKGKRGVALISLACKSDLPLKLTACHADLVSRSDVKATKNTGMPIAMTGIAKSPRPAQVPLSKP
jgi:hypothetical protein